MDQGYSEGAVPASDNKDAEKIIKICAGCKRMRNERGSWVQKKTSAPESPTILLSHALYPMCAQKFYPMFYRKKMDE